MGEVAPEPVSKGGKGLLQRERGGGQVGSRERGTRKPTGSGLGLWCGVGVETSLASKQDPGHSGCSSPSTAALGIGAQLTEIVCVGG